MALAAQERLAGVSMWRLGLEDPDVWEMLGTYVGRRPDELGSAAEWATGNE